MIIVFKGFIHITKEDFPRVYDFSWRENGTNCSIVFEISRDAVSVVAKCLKDYAPMLDYGKKEFGFKEFGNNLNAERYGFEDCAIVNQLKDGSVELVFELITINNSKALQYIFACAATINVLLNVLMSVPEKEIKDPLPQFMIISTACCKSKSFGHGGNIHGELNKDVKRYLMHHYEEKGEELEEVFSALLKAAEKIGGRKSDKLTRSLYWAKVRGEKGFLSIECPGNSCGLNSDEPDEYWSLSRDREERDFGMNLVCHNVDEICQQIVLIAALAALSDEVKKYYLESGSE